MLGARDRQRPWLRAGSNDDVPGFKLAAVHANGVAANEGGLAENDIDATPGHQIRHPGRDVPDDVLFPFDQGSPVKPRRIDGDRMSTIAPDEIIELIAAVRGHHPGVELHLCDSDAKSLRRRLLEGDLEAAIYALPSDVPDEEVHSLPLFQEQMVMAVHLNHRLANQRSVRVKDMGDDGEQVARHRARF